MDLREAEDLAVGDKLESSTTIFLRRGESSMRVSTPCILIPQQLVTSTVSRPSQHLINFVIMAFVSRRQPLRLISIRFLHDTSIDPNSLSTSMSLCERSSRRRRRSVCPRKVSNPISFSMTSQFTSVSSDKEPPVTCPIERSPSPVTRQQLWSLRVVRFLKVSAVVIRCVLSRSSGSRKSSVWRDVVHRWMKRRRPSRLPPSYNNREFNDRQFSATSRSTRSAIVRQDRNSKRCRLRSSPANL